MPDAPPPTHAWKREQQQAAKQQEPKSWGEALQRYDTSRRSPAHPSLLSPTPPSKHGVYNAQVQPPSFNPLLQSYINPQRENAARSEEAQRSQAQLQAARVRADHNPSNHGYNVLTGVRSPTTNTSVAKRLDAEDASRSSKVLIDPLTGKRSINFTYPASHPPPADHNILTNQPTFVNSYQRLAERDAVAERKRQAKAGRSEREAREFSIVSNKYVKDHEQRFHEEQTRNAERLANQVERQRQERERRFGASVELAQRRSKALHALPPAVTHSEGRLYNLINPSQVKDEAQLSRYYETPQQRNLNGHRTQYEREAEVAARTQQQEQRNMQRSLNRISQRRVEETRARGFDIIANQPLGSSFGAGQRPASRPASQSQQSK